MCHFLNHSNKSWYEQADVIFEQIHKKVPCICSQTIINQSSVVKKLINLCKELNQIRESKTNNAF
ncbi:hypothetical protein [Mycoplasma mycoides]|nr:hypothetical protein [Mycoplasma mycoides]